MKMNIVMAPLAAILVSGGSALAQTNGTDLSPMSATSPVAIGSGSPVAPTGIPLGAVELAAPGISPAPIASAGCSTAVTPGLPTATALFDGGGTAGQGSTACAQGGNAGGTMPNAGSSTPMPPALSGGRAGIPMGSTEIVSPGLSPMLPNTTLLPLIPSSPSTLGTSPAASDMASPPAPLQPPCPVTGSFPDTTRHAISSSTASGITGC